jgi:D-3-phosphoglycerate dehydrogenase / 2-oxoglutarate reductase
MATHLDPLILDLLEWVEHGPRPYAEMIEAWRTSCPRLTVWEDAIDRGFMARVSQPGKLAQVELTEAGRNFIAGQRGQRRPNASSPADQADAATSGALRHAP